MALLASWPRSRPAPLPQGRLLATFHFHPIMHNSIWSRFISIKAPFRRTFPSCVYPEKLQGGKLFCRFRKLPHRAVVYDDATDGVQSTGRTEVKNSIFAPAAVATSQVKAPRTRFSFLLQFSRDFPLLVTNNFTNRAVHN